MHELALCGSIAGIVRKHADGRRVDTIHMRIGQLRQVVPDTLVYCWDVVSADTELDGSKLDVEYVAALTRCEQCGHQAAMGDEPDFRCASCGAGPVTVVEGEEFVLTSLDVA